MDTSTRVSRLNACFTVLARGFLPYLRESMGPDLALPWQDLSPDLKALLANAIREDESHVLEVLDRIEELGGKPELSAGNFPFLDFYFNYVEADYLARIARERLQADLASFEKAAAPLATDSKLGETVARIAAEKKAFVHRLEDWRAKRAAPAAAAPGTAVK